MAMAAAPAAAAKKTAAKKTAAKKTAAAAPSPPGLPQRGSWKARAQGRPKKGPGRARQSLSGSSGRYRRILVAEFIVCVMLLAASPLARDDMAPGRFMKRGSATCVFFIVLGLVSAAGPAAGKAAAAFGGLATVALLVDSREAFGKFAEILNDPGDPDVDRTVGPDESTDDDPPVAAV